MDAIDVNSTTPTPQKKKHKNATKKQIMALQLINQGLSPRQAMIKAGYSTNVANNPRKYLFNSQAITNIVDKMQLELKDVNITTSYLAKKLAEWMEATTTKGFKIGKDGFEQVMEPDYKTQIAAYDRVKDIYGITPQKKDTEGLKRRMTLEEFITGDPTSQEPDQ